VNSERQSPYLVAFILLLAGAIPELAWSDGKFTADFTAPPASAAALGPEHNRSAVFYPAVAGVFAMFLAWSMPRWIRAAGFIAIGASLLALMVGREGTAAAFNVSIDALTPADFLLLGGIALAFVAMRAQADGCPGLPLALLGALAGVAVMVSLVVPGRPTIVQTWLGLVSEGHSDTFPIARGFYRNAEFQAGTHVVWIAWWNLYLVALVAFPLLCLRVPPRRRDLREGSADAAYGALVFVLLSLALTVVAAAAVDHQLKPRSPDETAASWQTALVLAANKARVVFPPMLMAGLVLVGVSDLLKSMCAVRLPWQPAGAPGEFGGQFGRIPLATERYQTPVPSR
jgi:hypothetical protein